MKKIILLFLFSIFFFNISSVFAEPIVWAPFSYEMKIDRMTDELLNIAIKNKDNEADMLDGYKEYFENEKILNYKIQNMKNSVYIEVIFENNRVEKFLFSW